MKSLPFAIALLPFSACLVQAGPITDPSGYETVGIVDIRELGHVLFGNFFIWDPVPPDNDVIVQYQDDVSLGYFDLNTTLQSGSFELLASSMPNELQVVESGNEIVGEFTIQQQGNPIVGEYRLVIANPNTIAPEPGTWLLAASGLVFLGAAAMCAGFSKRFKKLFSPFPFWRSQ